MPPEMLYKYVRPERIDILQNLKIRFTQVSALNDPFESFPGVGQRDREWYRVKFNQKVDAEISRLGIQAESKKKQFKRARKKEFNDFYKAQTDAQHAEELCNRVFQMSDHVFGCLSLSATPKNILMWSHYAKEHTGFVIGFDGRHAFFGERVKAVTYSDVRPSIEPLQSDQSGELFYTKSSDWSYEQEYRRFADFVEPEPMDNGNSFLPYTYEGLRPSNGRIYLEPLPKESVNCIILGWKSSPELHVAIKTALEGNQITPKILHAKPSITRYEMELIPA